MIRITLLILLTLSSESFAQSLPIWEQKINAQIAFQNDVAALLTKRSPELEEIIVISHDMQVTLYEMKRQKYLYLFAERRKQNEPPPELNFSWADEDEKNCFRQAWYTRN